MSGSWSVQLECAAMYIVRVSLLRIHGTRKCSQLDVGRSLVPPSAASGRETGGLASVHRLPLPRSYSSGIASMWRKCRQMPCRAGRPKLNTAACRHRQQLLPCRASSA